MGFLDLYEEDNRPASAVEVPTLCDDERNDSLVERWCAALHRWGYVGGFASAAAAFIVSILAEPPPAFALELRTLIIGCFLLALLRLFFRTPAVLAASFAFRFIFILLAALILPSQYIWVKLFLFLSFAIDGAVAIDSAEADKRNHSELLWIALIALALGVCAADLWENISGVPLSAWISPLVLLAFSLLFLVPLRLLVRGRRIIKGYQRQLAGIDATIDNLTNANRAFQDYAESIEFLSKEDERNRISRELHDLIGYSLTNIIALMNAVKFVKPEDRDQLVELVDSAKAQADSALQESRKILYTLRSLKIPTAIGLDALSQLIKGFSSATKIEVSINYGNFPQSMGERIDKVIYRFLQEGLTNAFKHGSAKKISVDLWVSAEEVGIRIWDNGKGAVELKEGIGLSGMRERFSTLGGNVEAKNVPDGFVLSAMFPTAVLEKGIRQI